MEKLADEKKMFYIIGDINIDINRTNQKSPQAERCMQVITSNGAFSLITKPTRVTDKTATVIDHIITNDTTHSIFPRVIGTSLTDHYAIMRKIGKIEKLGKKLPIFLYRNKKNFCPEAFSDNLNRELGNLISNNLPLNRDNFNKAFDQFVNLIAKIIDKHAPLQRLSRKQKKFASKPWITKGILISIWKKNATFRTHFIKGNLAEKTLFWLYSNTLTRIKALAKKIYFCSEFARNIKNPRKTWEIIRSALQCKPNREPPVAFKEIQDPNVIASQFHDYFCSIGSNLTDSIICTTCKQPKYFLEKRYLVPFILNLQLIMKS